MKTGFFEKCACPLSIGNTVFVLFTWTLCRKSNRLLNHPFVFLSNLKVNLLIYAIFSQIIFLSVLGGATIVSELLLL